MPKALETYGLRDEHEKYFSQMKSQVDEMHSIRCIEHNGKVKFITTFVGAQKDICEAFGF